MKGIIQVYIPGYNNFGENLRILSAKECLAKENLKLFRKINCQLETTIGPHSKDLPCICILPAGTLA